MQPSRLAAIACRVRACNNHWAAWGGVGQRLSRSASAGRTADPDIHGADYDDPSVFSTKSEETKNVAEHKPAAELNRESIHRSSKSEASEPLVPPNPLRSTSQRLESCGAHNPAEPSVQQRRQNGSASGILDSVSCAGLDGSPWPKEAERGGSNAEQSKNEDQVESDKEYFKHHKASPLSEIEIADTRKPITRATDGTAGGSYYGGEPGVVLWLPEQLDTAEEALLRAAKIWRESAMRGDPDAPQSRVLRALRGE